MDDGCDLYLCEYWNVVRAICDYRYIALPRLYSVELGVVPTDLGGYWNVDRQFRSVLYSVFAVLQIHADHRNGGDQGDYATW